MKLGLTWMILKQQGKTLSAFERRPLVELVATPLSAMAYATMKLRAHIVEQRKWRGRV